MGFASTHFLLQVMLSDGRTHFLQTGAENSTTHFLLLAFMVSWMAAVPTLYIHLKKEQTGEEKRNNINSFAQPIGKTQVPEINKEKVGE